MVKQDFLQSSFDDRKAESSRMLIKYPERICAYVQQAKDETTLPEITKNKYLIPLDITVGQLVYVIRKRIKLNEQQALFIFVNNKTIPTLTSTIGETYRDNASEDGFLYITYAAENTFGTF
jgi:GABA(A) receptor-associated protein